ncbi:MAG: sulfite exporter TauE/SafE family protein [Burkholderiales bacterium]
MPSTEVLVLTPLIVLLAYLIFGISGFGSTLIAVPLLAHILPLKFVIPVVVVLDCISAVSMGFKLRADVWKQAFLPMLPFLLVGLLIGAFVLLNLPTRWLFAGLGTFVVIFGGYYVIDRKSLIHLPAWTVAPVGLIAGVTSSAFGVGGPIYVFFFTARGATPEQVRATVPAVFSFTTVARIAIFTSVGLYDMDIVITVALLLPVMALGLWCGQRLHGRLSRDQAIRIIGGLLLLSGLSLLLRAAAT